MLKNGYYLSVYSSISLNHCIMKYTDRHDQNMTLWKKQNDKITLIHHWEFERYTGFKHHNISFYKKEDLVSFIDNMLELYDLSLLDMVAVFGTPEISNITEYHSINDFPDLSYHAISHLFSSMMMSSSIFWKENIVSLAIDLGSDRVLDRNSNDKQMFIGAVSVKGCIEYFPISSPSIYWAFCKKLFSLEEGTLMALAYATESISYELTPKTFFLDNEKLFDRNDVIAICYRLYEVKEKIFSYTSEDIGVKFNGYDERFCEEENRISMMIKFIQQLSLFQTERIIENIIEKYEIDPADTYISLSGGYALNCPTNTHLMQKYKFKGQLIIPCTNDGGQAIGMGLYYFYKNMGKFEYKFPGCSLGSVDENIDFLFKNENSIFIESIQNGFDKIISDLIQAPIVWFDGRSEAGPRALGNRSILADARNKRSKELLNQYKIRQWWRPVAPIVMEEHLDEYFDEAFKTPYMLNNFKIKKGKEELVPAILHLDGTCRVQSINQKENEKLYSIIGDFYHKTGVPIICNTSLNDKGEPIITTIPEAFNFALRKGIKIIYVNGVRVSLKNHDKYIKKEWEHRNYSKYFEIDDKTMKQNNPYELTKQEYFFCMNKKNFDFNLKNENDVMYIKKIFKQANRLSPVMDLVMTMYE